MRQTPERTFLFDLDGTLTESAEGIVKSVQYSLEKMGVPEPDPQKLLCFIGPPLVDQFMSHCGFSRDEALEAVGYYRERFSTVGIYENRLYPGVREMLAELTEAGHVLALASSKPERFARMILEHFEVADYFTEAVGATLDERRTTKAEVIEEALRRLGMSENPERALMVGDREHDVMGAREWGLECVGVTYGYGSREELEAVHPLCIVTTVDELRRTLLEL